MKENGENYYSKEEYIRIFQKKLKEVLDYSSENTLFLGHSLFVYKHKIHSKLTFKV